MPNSILEPINAAYLGLQETVIPGKYMILVNRGRDTEVYDPCKHNLSDHDLHRLFTDAKKVRGNNESKT